MFGYGVQRLRETSLLDRLSNTWIGQAKQGEKVQRLKQHTIKTCLGQKSAYKTSWPNYGDLCLFSPAICDEDDAVPGTGTTFLLATQNRKAANVYSFSFCQVFLAPALVLAASGVSLALLVLEVVWRRFHGDRNSRNGRNVDYREKGGK